MGATGEKELDILSPRRSVAAWIGLFEKSWVIPTDQ